MVVVIILIEIIWWQTLPHAHTRIKIILTFFIIIIPIIFLLGNAYFYQVMHNSPLYSFLSLLTKIHVYYTQKISLHAHVSFYWHSFVLNFCTSPVVFPKRKTKLVTTPKNTFCWQNSLLFFGVDTLSFISAFFLHIIYLCSNLCKAYIYYEQMEI